MNLDEITAELIESLYDLPDDATVSTLSLLRDCGFNDEDFMPVIMDIHRMLFEAAEAEQIRLEFVKSGLERTGPVYEAELRVTHSEPEEREIWSLEEEQDEEEKQLPPLLGPVQLFNRYLEIIFTNDELWEQFQMYVHDVEPDRDEDFFAYRRDLDCIDIWRMMLDNMGGGFPITLFAAASFLLLAFRDQGHDLNKELMKAYEKLNG